MVASSAPSSGGRPLWAHRGLPAKFKSVSLIDGWLLRWRMNGQPTNTTTQRLAVILYFFISTNSLLRLLFVDGFKGGSRHQYNHTTTTSSVRFLCKGFSHREFEVKRKKNFFSRTCCCLYYTTPIRLKISLVINKPIKIKYLFLSKDCAMTCNRYGIVNVL